MGDRGEDLGQGEPQCTKDEADADASAGEPAGAIAAGTEEMRNSAEQEQNGGDDTEQVAIHKLLRNRKRSESSVSSRENSSTDSRRRFNGSPVHCRLWNWSE